MTRPSRWAALIRRSADRRRNGASIAKFRTRRPAHICETSRYRAVFERPSYATRWRRTGWLGRQDSNLRISNQGWLFEASKEFPAIPMNQGIRDFCLRLAIDSDMQRFESCRPSQPVPSHTRTQADGAQDVRYGGHLSRCFRSAREIRSYQPTHLRAEYDVAGAREQR